MPLKSWSPGEKLRSSDLNANFEGLADGSLLENRSVTLAKVAEEAWTAFTPSWTNLTVGNGTNTGHYVQIGKTVIAKVRFVMGSTSSMGSSPQLTLPVEASTNSMAAISGPFGRGNIVDSGTATYSIEGRYASSTSATLITFDAAQTYLRHASITASVPMTWATNDEIVMVLIYEAA